jgi:hypothetical protein
MSSTGAEAGEAGGQRHARVHEREREHEIDQGRDTEEEREAAYGAGGEPVEHHRAQQRHEVGGDDRAERATEAAVE